MEERGRRSRSRLVCGTGFSHILTLCPTVRELRKVVQPTRAPKNPCNQRALPRDRRQPRSTQVSCWPASLVETTLGADLGRVKRGEPAPSCNA